MKALAMAAVVLLVPAGLARAQMMGGGMGGMGGGMGGMGAVSMSVIAANQAEARLDKVAGEVDEALLREALTLLGKHELRQAITKPKDEAESDALNAEVEGLKRFIEARRQAIRDRATKDVPKPTRPNEPAALPQIPANSEEVEKLRNQVVLLGIELNQGEQELTKVMDRLAQAEIGARINPEEKADSEAVRKTFQEVEELVIDLRKRRTEVMDRLTKLDPQGRWRNFSPMGGMNGGMGGMGGMM